jgi:hypothetical protein
MRSLCAASVLLLTGISSVNILLACGDKFLVSSRGTRYRPAVASRRPIYTDPASELPKALASVPVDATLRSVGYRPTTVGTPAEFEKALSEGGWDLILVGLADAEAARKRVQSNAGVVPVVVNATAAEMKQTKQQYPFVLSAPTKPQTLVAVDEALASRSDQEASEACHLMAAWTRASATLSGSRIRSRRLRDIRSAVAQGLIPPRLGLRA